MAGADREPAAAIRAAVAADLPAVMELWDSHGSGLNAIPDDRGELECLIGDAPGSLLVAESADGAIVGALIVAFDGHRGHMHRLAVDPSHRCAGIARRLVAEGHERLRTRGARRVDAILGDGEEAAIALWRSAGYESDPALVRFARNL